MCPCESGHAACVVVGALLDVGVLVEELLLGIWDVVDCVLHGHGGHVEAAVVSKP